jgi:hypothetical protein
MLARLARVDPQLLRPIRHRSAEAQSLGLVHMNPGACGHNGWHLVRTPLRFTVERGKIRGQALWNCHVLELGWRCRG